MTKIAIFDVCDTLYDVNTTFSFLDFYLRKNKKYLIFRRISKFFLIKLLNYILFRLFKKDLIRIFATYFLKNHNLVNIKNSSSIFVKTILSKVIKKKILTYLKYYKENDYKIVFMSGSYDFIIEEVSNYFGASEYYASKLKIKNSNFLGSYREDILVNKYKLFKENYKSFNKLAVVSNNKTDLKLMSLANEAFAVCNKKSDFKFWSSHSNIDCIKDF
tara:strand:- start:11554 stop:12204 length:651 start_codon:yes stop_codon:yes gene_type:complete